MKKVILASDSFKGTLSSNDIIETAKEVVADNKLDIDLNYFAIADGGEGTVDAFASQLEGRKKTITIKDANGYDISATYFLYKNRAIIEVASAISLPNTKIQNPLITSTVGVGELIKDAIKENAKEIIIGLGGSSTNDGGIGMLSALGVKFYDKNGFLLDKFSNEDLSKINHFDVTECNQLIKGITFIGMCDVKNPLLGEQGATYIFSPQKGATKEMLPILETNMSHYASIVVNVLGNNKINAPGSGAAGGLGFALISFLNAELKSGINLLLDSINFNQKIKDADLVISGEGRLDNQSFSGKVIDGISDRCNKFNVPLTLIVGAIKKDFDERILKERKIKEIILTSTPDMLFEEIKKNAKDNYKAALLKALSK